MRGSVTIGEIRKNICRTNDLSVLTRCLTLKAVGDNESPPAREAW